MTYCQGTNGGNRHTAAHRNRPREAKHEVSPRVPMNQRSTLGGCSSCQAPTLGMQSKQFSDKIQVETVLAPWTSTGTSLAETIEKHVEGASRVGLLFTDSEPASDRCIALVRDAVSRLNLRGADFLLLHVPVCKTPERHEDSRRYASKWWTIRWEDAKQLRKDMFPEMDLPSLRVWDARAGEFAADNALYAFINNPMSVVAGPVALRGMLVDQTKADAVDKNGIPIVYAKTLFKATTRLMIRVKLGGVAGAKLSPAKATQLLNEAVKAGKTSFFVDVGGDGKVRKGHARATAVITAARALDVDFTLDLYVDTAMALLVVTRIVEGSGRYMVRKPRINFSQTTDPRSLTHVATTLQELRNVIADPRKMSFVVNSKAMSADDFEDFLMECWRHDHRDAGDRVTFRL